MSTSVLKNVAAFLDQAIFLGGVVTLVDIGALGAVFFDVACRVVIHEAQQRRVGHTSSELISYGRNLSVCVILGKCVPDALQLIILAAHIKHVSCLVLAVRVIMDG